MLTSGCCTDAPSLVISALPYCSQAAQFAQSRREELLELQRTLLGMEDIAVQEGLKPSEAEIEVGGGQLWV